MTKEELAQKLNGADYPHGLNNRLRSLKSLIRDAGLVVVYGASDDLMEFDGAINDELGAYGGQTALVDAEGLLPNREEIDDDEELEKFFSRKPFAREIKAVWNPNGPNPPWTFETTIPHATFEVTEDEGVFCRGIVFALEDAGSLVVAPRLEAFLIEANKPETPKFWLTVSPRTPGKISFQTPFFDWTPDAANALKFADAESAERMIPFVSRLNPDWEMIITGHTFDSGAEAWGETR